MIEMGGMSRLAFALALTVILTLTLLLTFLLGLLANLFCSLLRRRERHLREESPLPEPTDRPISFPFYAHGVLQAPTEFLLSSPTLEEAMATRASPSPPPLVNDFLCISNPIYDGANAQYAGGKSGVGTNGDDSTPFVTPKASPSGLEVDNDSNDYSPPMKLMKKLPPVLPKATLKACLFDRRQSLGMSTETYRPSSSSSSNSLCSSW